MIPQSIKNTFRFNFIIAPAVLCWCLFYLGSCKDTIIEDSDLLTPDDNLNLAKDTLAVKIFNLFEAPLESDDVVTGVLANIDDPNFGKTVGGFYAQCRLSSNNVSFGVNAGLDSIVLSLAYAAQYGPFDKPVGLAVYELAQALNDSVDYKTTDAFQVSTPPIALNNAFVANLKDSITIQGLRYPPHLRVPLSTAFGNKIVLANSTDLVDNTAFLNLFKGFYLTSTSNSTGNGLVYFNLRSTLSKIVLYYHNDAGDSLQYDIPVSGATVNHFDNNYSGTPVATSVNTPNPNGESKLYLQGGAGVKGKIEISGLDSLPANIAVNKAELVLTQAAGDTTYALPAVLDLFRIDDAGEWQVLEDETAVHFGGVRTAETVNGATLVRYRFNIQKYFQKLVKGDYKNNGLYLQIVGANSNSERAVFSNSSTDKNYSVTLAVTYTKL